MKIWLAWAPSSWKSSVVAELQRRGFRIFPEAATQIIRNRTHLGESLEDILGDHVVFQNQIHEKKREQYTNALYPYNFFDTTIVEDIAHRVVTGVETDSIQDAINRYRYDTIFYMTHPGTVEDNWIRVESETEVQELDRLKREAFRDNWYDIVEVPTFVKQWQEWDKNAIETAITARVDYILDHISIEK